VVAVAIVGILAATAAPKLSGRVSYHQVSSAAERIASDFNLARRQAKTTGVRETVSFDVPNHRYTLSGVTSLKRPVDIYTVELSAFPYRSSLLSVDFGGGATVTFNAFGLPDNGGKIFVQSGTEQRVVYLDFGSGKATIQ